MNRLLPMSFLSQKTEVLASDIHGRGLFAREAMAKGEIVAVKGGHIFDRKIFRELEPLLGPAEIQINDDLFIGPTTMEDREGSMIFSNHSCDPNIGVQGQIVFVAMRDIQVGEELSHDWARLILTTTKWSVIAAQQHAEKPLLVMTGQGKTCKRSIEDIFHGTWKQKFEIALVEPRS